MILITLARERALCWLAIDPNRMRTRSRVLRYRQSTPQIHQERYYRANALFVSGLSRKMVAVQVLVITLLQFLKILLLVDMVIVLMKNAFAIRMFLLLVRLKVIV